MSDFQRGFRASADFFLAEAVGNQVSSYADRVEASVEELVRDMAKVGVNDKGLHFAKGDVAELWHAGTLNLDATQHGIDVAVFAPRDTSPIDIALRGGDGGLAAQLKYYRGASDTAKAISQPEYDNLHKVVPGDQLEGVREVAARLASKNLSRPDVAESYDHTSHTADDRLRFDGAESRPLTEAESRRLTEQLRQDNDIDREAFGLTPKDVLRWEDILRDSTTAAVRAAIITLAMQSAPYFIAIAKKGIESGEISRTDFAPLGRALPTALLRSSLSGGFTAAVVGAARMGVFGVGLTDLDPTFISAVVVICMCAVENSFEAAAGKITKAEAAARTAEAALTLAVTIGFAAIGQTLIPIPLLGTLLGSLIGGVVAGLMVKGTDQVVLSIAVDTGWTFFGLVDQNYSVPVELLKQAGWRSIDLNRLEPRLLQLRTFEPKVAEFATVDLRILRRGVLSFRQVGFVA